MLLTRLVLLCLESSLDSSLDLALAGAKNYAASVALNSGKLTSLAKTRCTPQRRYHPPNLGSAYSTQTRNSIQLEGPMTGAAKTKTPPFPSLYNHTESSMETIRKQARKVSPRIIQDETKRAAEDR